MISHSFYLGSEGTPATGDDVIVLSQYQYTAGAVRTRMYQTIVNRFNRLFYVGFTRNGFVYYFLADRNPSSIRVLRACDCESLSCTSNILWYCTNWNYGVMVQPLILQKFVEIPFLIHLQICRNQ